MEIQDFISLAKLPHEDIIIQLDMLREDALFECKDYIRAYFDTSSSYYTELRTILNDQDIYRIESSIRIIWITRTT